MKTTITFIDEPNGKFKAVINFDPPLDMKSDATPAVLAVNHCLEALAQHGAMQLRHTVTVDQPPAKGGSHA
jgi:hypothetical protein